MCCIFICTRKYGIGLSDDSVTYISVAQNVISGNGYVNFLGDQMLMFPPLYPAILAVLSIGVFDIREIACYLNIILFGLLIITSIYWFSAHFKSTFLIYFGAGLILFSIPIIEIAFYAWSEILFILFIILALSEMQQFNNSENTRTIFIAGLFTALACLVRYIGLSLVLTGILLILFNIQIPVYQKIKRVLIFSLISMLTISFWILNNYLHSNTLFGYRNLSRTSFINNIYSTGNIIAGWFLPANLSLYLKIIISALLLCIIIIGIIFIFKRGREAFTSTDKMKIAPLIIFIISFVIVLILSSSIIELDPADNRLLSPIYLPLLFLVIFSFDRIRILFKNKFIHFSILLIFCLWSIYSISNAASTVRRAYLEGAGGHHTVKWMESELIASLKKQNLKGTIFTNEPNAVYILTDNHSISNVSQLMKTNELIKERNPKFLVLFNQINPSFIDFLSSEKFNSRYKLDELFSNNEGKIYLIIRY